MNSFTGIQYMGLSLGSFGVAVINTCKHLPLLPVSPCQGTENTECSCAALPGHMCLLPVCTLKQHLLISRPRKYRVTSLR